MNIKDKEDIVIASHKIISRVGAPMFRYLNKVVDEKLRKVTPRNKLRFEVHLVEHCNLNCRGCDNYSPLADKCFLSVDDFERDLERLSELFDGRVEIITMLGGEPLLHPDLPNIMRIARESFPEGRIRFISNGTLIPKMKKDFWDACTKYHIDIDVTMYPVDFDYDRAISVARDHGIDIDMINKYPVKYFVKHSLDVEGKQNDFMNFINCGRANGCIVLKKGRMYTCTAAAHSHILEERFSLGLNVGEINGIDIYKAQTSSEIMEFLAKPIPFCTNCMIGTGEREVKWKVSEKKQSEWV